MALMSKLQRPCQAGVRSNVTLIIGTSSTLASIPSRSALYCLLQYILINCCIHCCVLQISHVRLPFPLLSLYGHIVSCQSNLFDHRPMFVLVSLFPVCLPVFLLWLSAEHHNVLMCFVIMWPALDMCLFSGCLS